MLVPYTTIESFKTAALVHGTDANENVNLFNTVFSSSLSLLVCFNNSLKNKFLRLMFEQRRVLPQRTIQTINDGKIYFYKKFIL